MVGKAANNGKDPHYSFLRVTRVWQSRDSIEIARFPALKSQHYRDE
jgi:hypothetical protein